MSTISGRRWAGAVVALVALLSATAVVNPPPARAAAGSPATARNNQWASFANSNGDWNGADGTIGHRLNDGRIVWTFSDTFKGPTAEGNVRPPFQTGFVRNSMVVQGSSSASSALTSVRVGGTGWDAQTLVPAPSGSRAGSYLWAGDGVVSGSTLKKLYMVFSPPEGCEIYGMPYATAMATFDVSGATPRLTGNRLVRSGTSAILWGTATLDVGNFTYIYGTEFERGAPPNGCGVSRSHLHIARVPKHDFAAPWQYFTNGSWTTAGQGSRVMQGVSSEFSVTRTGGRYVLVTQQVAGAGIVSYSASSPTGFRTNVVSPVLYSMPEHGASRHVYAARLQPGLSNSTNAVITYNVNTARKSADACADENMFNTTIYRPRFVNVPVSALTSTGGTAMTAVDADAGVVDGRGRHHAAARAGAAGAPAAPTAVLDAVASDAALPTPATEGASLTGAPVAGADAAPPVAADPFPVGRIQWLAAGATCPGDGTSPLPTGVSAQRSANGTSATVTWNYRGPTMYSFVYRSINGTWGELPFMAVGAWPIPHTPAASSNPFTPIPATGTPTRIRLQDFYFSNPANVQYKVCHSRWNGAPERCTAPFNA